MCQNLSIGEGFFICCYETIEAHVVLLAEINNIVQTRCLSQAAVRHHIFYKSSSSLEQILDNLGTLIDPDIIHVIAMPDRPDYPGRTNMVHHGFCKDMSSHFHNRIGTCSLRVQSMDSGVLGNLNTLQTNKDLS